MITALVAPTPWLLFGAKKQLDVPCNNILFTRMGGADVKRRDHTLAKLCAAAKHKGILVVASIGTPGIGKSAEMNRAHFELVRNLGKNGWPNVVGLRVDSIATIFSFNNVSQAVSVQAKSVQTVGEGSELFALSEDIQKQGGVLLVEVNENESMHAFACPTHVSLSSREADTNLKFNSKVGRSVEWLVVGSWLRRELIAAALVEHAVGRKDLGATSNEVVLTICERWRQTGGIPRAVLGSQKTFDVHLTKQSVVRAVDLNWSNTTVWDVGRSAKLFMCPEPGTEGQLKFPALQPAHLDNFQWAFLCPERANCFNELLRACNERHDVDAAVRSLHQFGLEWQVQEEYVCQSLLGEEKDLDWEW